MNYTQRLRRALTDRTTITVIYIYIEILAIYFEILAMNITKYLFAILFGILESRRGQVGMIVDMGLEIFSQPEPEYK